MAETRPFDGHYTGNLQRKLAIGAVRPDIAELIRAELRARGEPETKD